MTVRRLNNLIRNGLTFGPSISPAIGNTTASGSYPGGKTYYVWANAGEMGTLNSGGSARNLQRVDHGVRTVTPSTATAFTTNPIEYWVVSGGGGGASGNTAGAGGGAGGYATGTLTITSPLNIIVGWGGTGSDSLSRETYPGLGQGGPSVFGPVSVIGGGRGAMGGGTVGNTSGPPEGDASPGASGGGGARFHPIAGGGTPGIGNTGGPAPGCPGFGSGGGGGATGAGEGFFCFPISIAGQGGAGIQMPSPFRPLGYGAPGPASPTGYFCGGGGGSNWNQSEAQLGGFGGGGGWNSPTTPRPGSVGAAQTFNALPNSGGGGGGTGNGENPRGTTPLVTSSFRGGDGGSGIVIIIT
jgi:hypothetical protein